MVISACLLLLLPQGYDILEDMYSPKTATANFAHKLCTKKKVHLDAFMRMLVGVRKIKHRVFSGLLIQLVMGLLIRMRAAQPVCGPVFVSSRCGQTEWGDRAHRLSLPCQSNHFPSPQPCRC